jgi:hypothetical protein
MSKVDWEKAPEWADRALLNAGRWFYADENGYLNLVGDRVLYGAECEDVRGTWLALVDFEDQVMRPDEWKKGAERMEQIAQNGNDGQAYEGDGQISAYHRKVKGVWIDFYDIAEAFDPENRNSADDHALKKMLLPGKRHTKGGIQDRREAIKSIERAIEKEQEKTQ